MTPTPADIVRDLLDHLRQRTTLCRTTSITDKEIASIAEERETLLAEIAELRRKRPRMKIVAAEPIVFEDDTAPAVTERATEDE